MASNIRSLAGRTLFISGASRGIGLNIALRAAADGANVVVAAKTTVPHPKLPGTIYTAAKEIEAAGGQCLPCVVDIRNEEQVADAFKQAAERFGGIDILVNNASAIHLTGTEATPMKKYDLMHQVNIRGTFLCSKYAAPYLRKAANPHILNISPPLNMSAMWFQHHVAYTMAKYGMSMCVLGMAQEFKPDGISVNALWPQTAIYTAAMEMLGGGGAIKEQCRRPEIVSDAAHAILTRDSKSITGNFYIDEVVLREEGTTDLEKYAYVKNAKMLPDFFLEDLQVEEFLGKHIHMSGGSPLKKDASGPAATFALIESRVNADLVKSIGGVFAFNLKDDGKWFLDLKNGAGSCGQGAPPSGEADCTMTLNAENFEKMFAGKLNATSAFMTGKLKIKGDMPLAMKLDKLMKTMHTPAPEPVAAPEPAAPASGVTATFTQIQATLNEELVGSIGGIFTFDLKDDGKWYLDLKNGAGSCGQGAPPSGEADCTMTLNADSFQDMFAGKLNATSAFMSGKLKIKGDLPLAMKLEKLMKKMQAKQ